MMTSTLPILSSSTKQRINHPETAKINKNISKSFHRDSDLSNFVGLQEKVNEFLVENMNEIDENIWGQQSIYKSNVLQEAAYFSEAKHTIPIARCFQSLRLFLSHPGALRIIEGLERAYYLQKEKSSQGKSVSYRDYYKNILEENQSNAIMLDSMIENYNRIKEYNGAEEKKIIEKRAELKEITNDLQEEKNQENISFIRSRLDLRQTHYRDMLNEVDRKEVENYEFKKRMESLSNQIYLEKAQLSLKEKKLSETNISIEETLAKYMVEEFSLEEIEKEESKIKEKKQTIEEMKLNHQNISIQIFKVRKQHDDVKMELRNVQDHMLNLKSQHVEYRRNHTPRPNIDKLKKRLLSSTVCIEGEIPTRRRQSLINRYSAASNTCQFVELMQTDSIWGKTSFDAVMNEKQELQELQQKIQNIKTAIQRDRRKHKSALVL